MVVLVFIIGLTELSECDLHPLFGSPDDGD